MLGTLQAFHWCSWRNISIAAVQRINLITEEDRKSSNVSCCADQEHDKRMKQRNLQ